MPTLQDNGPLQSSIERLRGELERVLDMARDRGGKALDMVGIKNPVRPEFPAVDLTETTDAIHLVADLPGVDADLLDLNITGQTLRLRGTVAPPSTCQVGTPLRSERCVGMFERTLTLPCGVDADNAHAELRQGVLHLRLPKCANEVGRKIAISTSTEPGPATA